MGDEAGIKSATFTISGEYAFGLPLRRVQAFTDSSVSHPSTLQSAVIPRSPRSS